jgi:hypothetical protein
MSVDGELIRALDFAFQESDVAGVRLSEDEAAVELLVEVRFLPETGPEADDSRILAFRQPALLRVLVRLQTGFEDPHLGLAIPLSGLDDLEHVFASLVWTDSQMQTWGTSTPHVYRAANGRTVSVVTCLSNMVRMNTGSGGVYRVPVKVSLTERGSTSKDSFTSVTWRCTRQTAARSVGGFRRRRSHMVGCPVRSG